MGDPLLRRNRRKFNGTLTTLRALDHNKISQSITINMHCLATKQSTYFPADFTSSSYVNSFFTFLEAKYAPPPDWAPKGKENVSILFPLLIFFATKTDTKSAANPMPVRITVMMDKLGLC
jgi:hypothetical protein